MKEEQQNVALIYPRFKYISADPPLGLAYLASHLINSDLNLKVSIYDGNFYHSSAHLLRQLEQENVHVAAIQVDSSCINDAIKLAQTFNRKSIITIAGGPMATVSPHTLTQSFGIVVMGEAEFRLPNILTALRYKNPVLKLKEIPGIYYKNNNGTIEQTSTPWPTPELNKIELPAYELLNMHAYTRLWPYLDQHGNHILGTNIIGSRGCQWQCSFCQPTLNKIFGQKIRTRSVSSIIEEIEYLTSRYNIKGIFFHDDNLTTNKTWTKQLCSEVSKLKNKIIWGCNSRIDVLNEEMIKILSQSGCKAIHLGIEAGSDRIRNKIYSKSVKSNHIKKVINLLEKYNISSLGFFIFGAPTESMQEMLKTLLLSQTLSLSEASFSVLNILPGTILSNQYHHHQEEYDYYSKSNIDKSHLHVNKITVLLIKSFANYLFYSSPKRWLYILRHFKTSIGRERLFLKASRINLLVRIVFKHIIIRRYGNK